MTDHCGAKSRNGSFCKRPAGWGTKHVGIGKCKLHGGATPVKHGLYSKYTQHRLAETVAQLAHDPLLIDIRQQVAIKQALLVDKLNQLQSENLSQDEADFIANLSEKVSRDIERINKIESGEKYVLQIEEVRMVINQITFILSQEIDDHPLIDRISKRLQDIHW